MEQSLANFSGKALSVGSEVMEFYEIFFVTLIRFIERGVPLPSDEKSLSGRHPRVCRILARPAFSSLSACSVCALPYLEKVSTARPKVM